MLPLMQNDELRKSVKKLLIDADLDKRGCLPKIAEKLNVNYNSLNMALSGYRDGPGSIGLLEKLQSHLVGLVCPKSTAESTDQPN